MKHLKLALVSTLALVTLAGCGRMAASSQASGDALGLNDGYQTQSFQAMPQHPGFGHASKMLSLSTEQQDRLKAIAERYRAELPAPAEHLTAVKSLLLAPAVDTTQLTTLMTKHRQALADRKKPFVAMLKEMRGVLTPDQLARAERLMDHGPMARMHAGNPAQHLDRFLADLKLTAAQQENLAQLKRKLAERTSQHDAMKQAFLGFVKSGDTAALEALHGSTAPAPASEVVAFVSSLDLAQRQQLITNLERAHARGPHRGMGH